MSQHTLVTGAAGFIGSHLVDQLLARGDSVTAIDSFEDNYDVRHKRNNIRRHMASPRYRLVEADVRSTAHMETLTDHYDVVVHLAARVGARPVAHDALHYQDVNVGGTQVLLEFARRRRIPQFVFASSASVYGATSGFPWKEDQILASPTSPYASAKLSGERLGHAYSDRFGLRFIALRIFAAYGPRQRPDMVVRRFATAMVRGEAIPFHGDGRSRRDHTYIDDVVEGLLAAMEYSDSRCEVINLGSGRATTLLELLHSLAATLGVRARLDRLAWPSGEIRESCASIEKARALLGYRSRTTLPDGLARFFDWMKEDSVSPAALAGQALETIYPMATSGFPADAGSNVAPATTPAPGYRGSRHSLAVTPTTARQ